MLLWMGLVVFAGLLIIIGQALYTRQSAVRLPEATGERQSLRGHPRMLLHIGESTVAGVGVRDIDQGLTANVVRALQSRQTQAWDWQVQGSNGARAGDAAHWPVMDPAPDLLLVTFGVNDTTHFTSLESWLDDLQVGIRRFAGEHTRVFVTGVPPLDQFPLLPFPLNAILGWRAGQLNQALAALCERQGWGHIDVQLDAIAHLMAEDGYHPNACGYQVWGEAIAERIATAADLK